MYEGSPRKFPRPTSTPRSSLGRNAACRSSPRKRNSPPRWAGRNAKSRLNIVPDEILQEAKKLAGDRFVPALLTPGKLGRETACKAIQDEVGKKLVEKFGAEKVTDFVINDAFYYIQRKASAVLIWTTASGSTAAPLMWCARFRARSACCRARMARRCSAAAKPRRSRWPRRHRRRHAGIRFLHRWRNRKEIHFTLQLPEFLRRRNRTHQRPGRREIGQAPWRNARLSRCCQGLSLLRPRHQRDHGIQRLDLHGERLRRHTGIDGCGRSDGSPVAGISIGICTEYAGGSISNTSCSPTSSAGKIITATWIARLRARKKASPASSST